jgi:2-aminoadipate transaminase
MRRLSNRIENLKSSPIREILSVIDKPGMISFAGGLPALESMPELDLAGMPQKFLQYGESAGDRELRELICAQLSKEGLVCGAEQVLVLSGSQQGIDLVAKLFIDDGSAVAVEAPTYLAALQVFKLFGENLRPFDCGVKPAVKAVKDLRVLYTIPNFQNPSGYCYSSSERQGLAAFCEVNEIPLFEGDPYRELAFDSCCKTPVCSYMQDGSWIYQSSFSKSLAPGMRLGCMICSLDLIKPLSRLKQAADLHGSRISQWLTLQLLQDTGREQRLVSLRELYSGRRDAFVRKLVAGFSDLATWQIPPGGLFFWLRLNRQINLKRVLDEALKLNVAFMPGDYFFSSEVRDSYIRLNFSHANEDEAERGLAILAKLIRKALPY